MTDSQVKYFTGDITLPQDLIAQVQNLQQQIAKQIENGDVSISPRQDSITKLNKTSNQTTNLKKKLKELGNIKQQLSAKLKSISVEQKQIKALTNKMQTSNHRTKLQKSILTEEDKEKIFKLRKSQKDYEIIIRNKINAVMEQIREKEQEEQTEKMFKNDMKRKERLVKLNEKKAKMAESRSKTLQMLENSHLSIKRSQYTYIKNQLKDKKLQKERERYQEMILKQKKQKLKLDFSEIKQAAIQHDKLISDKKEEFLFQFKESQIRKRTKTITYESEFSRKLKSEEKIRELQKIREEEAKREVRQRIMNFQSVINEKHKPKATEESVFVPKKEVQVLEKLSLQQTRQKGNQYLKIARKKAKKISPADSKIEVSSDKIGPDSSIPSTSTQKYPNYLIELKKKNKQPNFFERILKQKRLSTRKVEEVIRWMQKKEEGHNIGPHKSPIKNEYSSALQKIKLLNSLYDNQNQLQI